MNTTTNTGRSRRLVLAAAVSVAAISTVGAYLAMVSFGVDILAMSPATAYATAGVFELSLVTVALLAREAARDTRPGGVLLSLTWGLSSASGVFAAWHELYMHHPAGAAVFRFLVPLLAALMWHLALIGDRHLATGTSWSSMRATARMHALFLTTEDAARAHHEADTSTASQRAVARAEAKRRKARAIALRTVPPDEMRARAAAHLDALSAVADAVSDVAAMHAATNHRVSGSALSGLSGHLSGAMSGPVLSGADSGETAARTLAATLADNRADTGADSTPDNGTDMSPDSRADSVRLSAVSAAGHPDNTARVRATIRPDNRPVSGPVSADRTARLSVVSALLSDHPDATTRDALSALAEHGHTVTDRTARRLLADARTTGADDLAAGA
ncbi:hypothetical protein [Isoptericola sp. BMS4]|uniref:hypothetical protein n=1 Tax=Isoptericola sp. BMS4 TaxID=2527875 RepID=UPI001422E598|nr:hypothetical protein [Isoptericola sp. BMS4]